MIWIALAVCRPSALIGAGIGHAVRNLDRPAWLRPNRRQALVATGSAIVVAIPIAIAAGLPRTSSRPLGRPSRAAEAPTTDPSAPSIDLSTSAAAAATSSGNRRWTPKDNRPWIGIGPGTFEFWWARNGTYAGFIRDAHSLYLESLAELGIVGSCSSSASSSPCSASGRSARLRAPPEQRLVLAAATAGAAGFAMAAALDWVWETRRPAGGLHAARRRRRQRLLDA